MSKYRINKEKCVGCGVCVATCDGATELGEDGKAKILDQEKLEKCGGETVCPYEAIEKEGK
jgi:ferredoxin